ncbi:toxin co-regulated pilus biosynthesis Q family protein [Trinickia fusca]|nr:toxin co-regulated pilus biosynthesis Q family protein [Trinickia fusca]
MLTDATRNLVQALVKSVQQASTPKSTDGVPEEKPSPSSPPSQRWTVARDGQLQAVLTDWCRRAGWTLVWKSEYSYRIDAEATFNGDFVSAVTSMLAALGNVSPPIYPDIYKGNRVLVIKNNPSR